MVCSSTKLEPTTQEADFCCMWQYQIVKPSSISSCWQQIHGEIRFNSAS